MLGIFIALIALVGIVAGLIALMNLPSNTGLFVTLAMLVAMGILETITEKYGLEKKQLWHYSDNIFGKIQKIIVGIIGGVILLFCIRNFLLFMIRELA